MLNVNELLSEASRRVGLTDFGLDDFRPRLERLVNSVNRESRFTPLGQAAFPEIILHALVNRLQVEDWYRRHPEIDEEEIVAPVFIVGFPRTGSTLLSYLLALDPRTRLIRQWESEQPCPPPVAGDDTDPRIAESGARQEAFLAAMPELLSMVPYNGPSSPVECYELFYPSFVYAHYDMFSHCPTYTDWFFGDTQNYSDGYHYHKRILKLLQWRNPPTRWALKMPSHSLMIEDLAKAYPEARYVMTHRDPVKVIPSTAHLNVTVRRQYLIDPQSVWFGEEMMRNWSKAMDRLIAFRNRHTDRFFDVYHGRQIADSAKQMRELYDWLGWKCSDKFIADVAAWRSENPKGNNQFHMAAYGLDPEAIKFRFADYRTRYPKAVEV
jgi:hypothetical protein